MLSKQNIERIFKEKLHKMAGINLIYQYAPFDIALNKIILKQTLRFADPSTFDDPFDCNEHLLDVEMDKEIVKKYLDSPLMKSLDIDKERLVKDIYNPQVVAQQIRNNRTNYKFSCFSSEFKEVLLWSNHADKHAGICVGFDFHFMDEDDFNLYPVDYVDEIERIDGTVDVFKIILYWINTKARKWKHEHEIRAISKAKSTADDYEYITYDKKHIKEIIFGCRVTDDQIKSVFSLIAGSIIDVNEITFKRLFIEKSTFKLREKEIKPIFKNRRSVL
jgi:hypothetical protein